MSGTPERPHRRRNAMTASGDRGRTKSTASRASIPSVEARCRQGIGPQRHGLPVGRAAGGVRPRHRKAAMVAHLKPYNAPGFRRICSTRCVDWAPVVTATSLTKRLRDRQVVVPTFGMGVHRHEHHRRPGRKGPEDYDTITTGSAAVPIPVPLPRTHFTCLTVCPAADTFPLPTSTRIRMLLMNHTLASTRRQR